MPSRSIRHLLLGLAAFICAAATVAIVSFHALQVRTETLAQHLPADTVMAYIVLSTADTDPAPLLARLAPTLPPPPTIDASVTAMAAIREADGTTGWITAHNADGTLDLRAHHPLRTVPATNGASLLAEHDAFQALQPHDGTGWIYLAYPQLPREGSPFASLLALETPLALPMTQNKLTLRVALNQAPRLPAWQGALHAAIPAPSLVLPLPPWNDMERLGTLLTEDARTIAHTLMRTFVSRITTDVSTLHDLPLLLDGPSLFQTGLDEERQPAFTIEGTGRNASDVHRLLKVLHDRFASTRDTGTVRTITAEGLTMHTLTRDANTSTVERQEESWLILETHGGDASLVSAQNGRHFVLASDLRLLHFTDDNLPLPEAGFFWSHEASARTAPLWPNLQPQGDSFSFSLQGGQGFVEWTLSTPKSI